MAKPSAFQFSNPVLEKINFKLNDNNELETGKLSLQFGTTDFKEDEEGGKSAKARLIIANEKDEKVDDSQKQLPYEFSVTYTAVFHWNKVDINDDQARKLLYVNGQALLLSYFRPIINTIVRASGSPNFNLPFIDFTNDENVRNLE